MPLRQAGLHVVTDDHGYRLRICGAFDGRHFDFGRLDALGHVNLGIRILRDLRNPTIRDVEAHHIGVVVSGLRMRNDGVALGLKERTPPVV